MFTKEQIAALYEAEVPFYTAIHSSNIISVPKWLTERVVEIYEAASGKTLNKNYGCAVCVLNIYKTVGPIYFKDKDKLQSNTKKNKNNKKCQENQTTKQK